jgi:hypothetical protein
MLGNYLEQSAKLFMDMQQRMRDQTRGMFAAFPFPNFGAAPQSPPDEDKKNAHALQQARFRAALLRRTPPPPSSPARSMITTKPRLPSGRGLRRPTPRVGFISLGCPKALVDSEQIVTQLKAEGYDIAPTYDGADMVVVSTCGFIDAAVAESLDASAKRLLKTARSLSPVAWGEGRRRVRARGTSQRCSR